ncbi:MAG TPA: DUF4252 domain-containing protein [Thermoanaerobaculia bacterium]|nr:DUF4252 domain-containing protein [Thermoanaerobaculia bacterium]
MRPSRFLTIAIALVVLLPAAALAQSAKLNLDFGNIGQQAKERVDVTLDGDMLRLAARFLSNDDADEKAVRDMVGHLDGIYVRSYQFDKAGMYDRAVVDKVKAQLGAEWKRIVTVEKKGDENVEIYLAMRNDRVAGMVIIAAEAKELTIVNIVGPIDIEKLSSIEGQFGIPRVTKHKAKKGDDHE